MEWVSMSVAIPASHIVEFHTEHAAWLAAALAGQASNEQEAAEPGLPWGSEPDDAARAEQVWGKISDRAKALLAVLIEQPGRKFSGVELAEQLGIPNGMYGVAGVLAWPTRHSAKVGRDLPVHFEYGEPGAGANYWMDDTTAAVFRGVVGPELER